MHLTYRLGRLASWWFTAPSCHIDMMISLGSLVFVFVISSTRYHTCSYCQSHLTRFQGVLPSIMNACTETPLVRMIVLPPAPVGQIKFRIFRNKVCTGYVYAHTPDEAARKLDGRVLDSIDGFACVTTVNGNYCLSW